MTTLRLLRGGLVDDEGPLHGRGRALAPLARTTTRGPVHVRDFLRAADDATEWRPRQGEFIVLVLYRFGSGAVSDLPSTPTLHAIAAQVSRTVRRSDVADSYAPSAPAPRPTWSGQRSELRGRIPASRTDQRGVVVVSR